MPLTVVHKPCNDPYLTITGVTFPSSYSTSGLALTAADLGWATLHHAWTMPKGGVDFEYNKGTAKLLAYLGTTDSSGQFAYSPGGGDIKGATADPGTAATADQASAPVNSALYVTAAATSGIANAATLTIAVQPAVPRNLMFTFGNASGGSLNLFEGDTVFTIVGVDARGNSISDTVTFTSTSGNKAVANNKFRYKECTKAFSSITTITLTSGTPNNAITIAVGPGTKFGLPIVSDTAANADILSFSVNAAPRTVSGNTDWTNYTVNTGTLADGDDVAVVYKIDAEAVAGTAYGTSFALPEVPASTDLSGLGEVLVFASGHTKA